MQGDLNGIRIFDKVVQTGSFTAAAKALGMPKSTVSQRVAELEAHLAARLLNRTTRRLGLTEAGRVYHRHCSRILAELEDADRAVKSLQQAPRGRLRMTLPASMQFLGAALTEFTLRHEGVQLEVLCTDRLVDLVDESFDLAIRAGALPDSTFAVRALGAIPFVVAASPRYLDRRGRPGAPRSLDAHATLVFGAGAQPRTWRLLRGQEIVEAPLTPTVLANDFDILHEAAARGAGIAVLPAFRCLDDFRTGRLERVLGEWSPPPAPVHALYPSARHLSPTVKAILKHLRETEEVPWRHGS